MASKVLAITISMMLAASTALACGPSFTPRYGIVPYIDISHGANRNFLLLLDAFHTPSAEQSYVGGDTFLRQYTSWVEDLINESGRTGLTIFDFQRLKKHFCPDNNRETLVAAHTEFAKQHLPRHKNHCRGDCELWRERSDLNHEVNSLFSYAGQVCGPYVQWEISRDIASIEKYEGESPYNEYAWLGLAYYHTYAGKTEQAEPYILNLAQSPLEGAKAAASRLKEINARLSSTSYPIAIPLHLRSSYQVSWCTNESKDVTLQYTRSVLASNVTDQEAAKLIEARHLLLLAGCSKMEQHDLERFNALTQSLDFTGEAVAHARYLQATKAFYEQDYGTALSGFEELHESNAPWVAEASLYMSGRIPLLQSQEKWNGYSTPGDEIDQVQVNAAEEGYDRYLEAYPQGRFAASAIGLKRKIAYLRGDSETLDAKLNNDVNTAADAFITAPSNETREDFTRLFAEWKRHSIGVVDYATASPLLIAYDVLRGLEAGEERLQALKDAKSRFAEIERVYLLLRYMTLLATGSHEHIVAEPLPTVFDDNIDVAIAAFHAQASERAALFPQARSTWLAIHESSEKRKTWDTVQARIAETYIQENDYRGLARNKSHVTLRKIFEDAFATACEESVLIDIAANITLNPDAYTAARDEVFRRRIERGDYSGLHALFEKLDEPGDFSLIQTAARMTAENPDNAKGLLNLGYYMLKKMSPHHSSLPRATEEDIAGTCPVMDSRNMGPRDYFYRVVELHDDGHKSVDEAKALHYLVMCDKPGYHSNECNWYGPGGRDRPSGEALFRRLHEKYSKSKWARETPYYYD